MEAEKTIDYIEKAERLANRLQLPLTHQLAVITTGFLAPIRTYVIQQQMTSMGQLRNAAVLAEKSIKPPKVKQRDVMEAIEALKQQVRSFAIQSERPSQPPSRGRDNR